MVDSNFVESSEACERLTRRFKALGDPTRLQVLSLLARRASCVCELQAALDVPGNLLSHHLKVLREAGLIDGEKQGRWIEYRLSDGLTEPCRLLASLAEFGAAHDSPLRDSPGATNSLPRKEAF